MRRNRRERGEKRGEEGERTKECRVGAERGTGGRGKRRARTDSGVLALQHAGTLARVQASVCVGRVTSLPTVLLVSREKFRR